MLGVFTFQFFQPENSKPVRARHLRPGAEHLVLDQGAGVFEVFSRVLLSEGAGVEQGRDGLLVLFEGEGAGGVDQGSAGL